MEILKKIDNILNEKKKVKIKKPSYKEIKKRFKKFKKTKFKKPSKPSTALTISGKVKKAAKKFFSSLFKKMKLTESDEYSEKVDALAEHLNVEPDTISVSHGTYESDEEKGEYIVLSDDEADKAARRYIEDSVWAFNIDFTIHYIDLKSTIKYLGLETSWFNEDEDEEVEYDDDEEVFYMNMGMSLEDYLKQLQDKSEGGNDDILNLIEDMDWFVKDAIASDGRGHYLSNYDGRENEEEINGTYYYIYRTN